MVIAKVKDIEHFDKLSITPQPSEKVLIGELNFPNWDLNLLGWDLNPSLDYKFIARSAYNPILSQKHYGG